MIDSNSSTPDETVLIELCKMWSSAMRMSPDLELDPEEMKTIGDRLLNTEAKSIETILLKLRSAHATAERSLDDGHPVRNLLASTIGDLDKMEQ
ncbi:MAG: hypothetical protein HOG95_10580 [Rhodospirillaceae bacterium]|jgi:hypothetical protein|nr:hypothetical protein [Rhodospirillaceae bacterium]